MQMLNPKFNTSNTYSIFCNTLLMLEEDFIGVANYVQPSARLLELAYKEHQDFLKFQLFKKKKSCEVYKTIFKKGFGAVEKFCLFCLSITVIVR